MHTKQHQKHDQTLQTLNKKVGYPLKKQAKKPVLILNCFAR